jgi:SAM-dependent methyltransferase
MQPHPTNTNSSTSGLGLGANGLDLQAIKARQQSMWTSGDYAVIGATLQIVGERLCESADLQPGSRVLDVACGNGNASLAAARRYADVTGVDYVPELLIRASERASADRLAIRFVPGDAEALPFDDASFDLVLSTFGVMFTPDQAQAARELTRVCARGGRIALANWTPEGFIGQLLRTVSRYAPPPAGLNPPTRWGAENGLRELFDGRAHLARAERTQFTFRYRSPDHFIDVFRRLYGPTVRAFAALDAAGQNALHAELKALLEKFNTSTRALVIPAEYLEVVLEVE